MKYRLKLLIIPLILVGLVPLPAQDVPPGTEIEENGEDEFNDTEFATAVVLSNTVSGTTGIAMSPLLGMGVLGAWKYFKSDQAMRDDLPWYTNPWVWGLCFGIFVLLKSKDTFGALIPEIVKKPLTVIDDFQDKASAAIVALAVIPTAVLNEVKDLNPQTSTETPMAMAPFIVPALMIAVSITIFVVVWFAFSALGSIKILSPSSVINTGISIVRGFILGAFALLALLNPWIGLALSVLIIVFCALIFGWAFRWNVFGILFVKDFFTGAFDRELEDGEALNGFATGHFPGVKPRTYGRIKREGEYLVFSWKPWLIFPRQKVKVNLHEVESSIRKGVFIPSVTVSTNEEERHRSIFDFRLRYRSQVEQIQKRLDIDSLSPHPMLVGVRACWDWFKDQVQKGGASFAEALSA